MKMQQMLSSLKRENLTLPLLKMTMTRISNNAKNRDKRPRMTQSVINEHFLQLEATVRVVTGVMASEAIAVVSSSIILLTLST